MTIARGLELARAAYGAATNRVVDICGSGITHATKNPVSTVLGIAAAVLSAGHYARSQLPGSATFVQKLHSVHAQLRTNNYVGLTASIAAALLGARGYSVLPVVVQHVYQRLTS
jgi:hypothetical protein